MTRKEAVNFLLTSPYKLGHMVGFKKLTELHNGWIIGMVRGTKDKTLQAHRSSYKTTCVSIALALIIVLLPNKRILFMRKTDTDIKEVVAQVVKILNSGHLRYFVQVIYGVDLKLTKETVNEISTNLTNDPRGTAQLVGLGIGSSLTGKHFDYIFTDDIININDRTSKAERDRTKLVYQELQNIKNKGGRIFNTLTPWHKDDASILMPEPDRWDCYSTGLMTEEQIAALKDSMTASLFSANYELRHIAAEDVIFEQPQTGADPSMAEQGEAHIDAAYGGDDWTAFTICRKQDGKYYVFGKCWRKHIDDVTDEIIRYRQAFNAGRIHCENNADKSYLAKALRAKGERVSSYHENQNKFIKITSYLKAEWKNVIFVAGTDDEYINQICDYNEHCEHDDCPDSLASLIRKMWNKKDVTESNYTPIFM